MYAIMTNPNTKGAVHVARDRNINGTGHYVSVGCSIAVGHRMKATAKVRSLTEIIDAMNTIAKRQGRKTCKRCVNGFASAKQTPATTLTLTRLAAIPKCLCQSCRDLHTAAHRINRSFGVTVNVAYPHSTNQTTDKDHRLSSRALYHLCHAINQHDTSGIVIPQWLSTISPMEAASLMRRVLGSPRKGPAAPPTDGQMSRLYAAVDEGGVPKELADVVGQITAETEATDLELIFKNLA